MDNHDANLLRAIANGRPQAQPNTAAAYEPASQAIARSLRAAIRAGRLEPGNRIRQEVLARSFGVSRLPVREALSALESEGLVTLIPHSGARVAQLDIEDHLEIYLIREALEPLAIAESATRITAAQIADLRTLVERLSDLAADIHGYLDLDRRFHLGTYAAAPLPRLLKMIDGFWNSTHHYRYAYMDSLQLSDFELIAAEHQLILDALERHDAEDAAALQRSHIRRTRLTLMRQPHLFDGKPAQVRSISDPIA